MVDRPPFGWPSGAGVALILLGMATPPELRAEGASPRSISMIPMASRQGQDLLLKPSTLRADYGPLVQWYETQANLAYCGVASAVMLLNSLGVAAPTAAGFGAYRFWTQTNLFTPAGSGSYVQASRVAREGMNLEQLHGLLASTGATVSRYHGEGLSLQQFRWLLQRGLGDRSDRLVANYDRQLLGQKGGGHISPLGAYEPRQDRVLILDVARYRYPAVWVTTADLWRSIRTVDSSSGVSRGVVVVSSSPGSSATAEPRAEPAATLAP